MAILHLLLNNSYKHNHDTICAMGALAEVAGDENNGEGSRTFVFEGESHTLGNALKTIVSRYPDVDFCGYTVPHPTESKLHFRIQSNKSRAIDILKRGLEDLEKLCDHVIITFEAEVKNFSDNKSKVPTI